MKNKVLVNVYVPSIDEEYEIYIPTNESINKVLQLIIKSVYDLSDSNLDQEVKHYILDPDTSTIFTNEQLIRNTNIKNGKRIILV